MPWTPGGYSGVLAAWAGDVIAKDGRFAFFFSNGGTNMGIMLATKPDLSDAADILMRPLVSTQSAPSTPAGVHVTSLTRGAYDPTLLNDDDGAAYVIFGYRHESSEGGDESNYLIARLQENLVALQEEPRPVQIQPDPRNGRLMPGGDKSTLHKRTGTYYLSAGTNYATATNVYGPYVFQGSTNPSSHDYRTFGLTGQAHGRMFEWRGQWFHAWCQFVDQNNTGTPVEGKSYHRWRDTWMTYLHYGQDGRMFDDWHFLDVYGRAGVGRYNAKWFKIQAEWYMQQTNCAKVQVEYASDGRWSNIPNFAVRMRTTSTLLFPNVSMLPKHGNLTLAWRGNTSGGHISVFSERDAKMQRPMAMCFLPVVENKRNVSCAFERRGKLRSKDGLVFRYVPQGVDVALWRKRARRAWRRRSSDVLAPDESDGTAAATWVDLDWWSLQL
jgi:hypothetical protein